MKKICVLLIMGLWVCLLAGCSETKDGVKESSGGTDDMGQSGIEEIFALDAPQEGYPEKAAIVKADMLTIDVEKAKAVFLEGKVIAEQQELQDESISVITEDMHALNSGSVMFTYTSMSQTQSAVMLAFHNFSQGDFAEFAIGEDLEFANIQQVNTEIQGIFKELGILEIPDYTCYSFRPEAFNQAVEQLEQQRQTKDNYTLLEEDCYFFYYRIPVENILISDQEHGDFEKGSSTYGSYISVIYTKDGIDTFIANAMLDLSKSQKEEEKPLISKEEAVEKALEKLGNIVAEGKIKIAAGSLEYISKRDYNNPVVISLMPCWRFILETEISGTDGSYILYDELLIDAQTGKELFF